MKLLKPIRFGRFLLFLSILFNISCKENRSTDKELVSIENIEIKPDSFDITVDSLMHAYQVPGFSIAFIKDGALHSARNYGVLQKGMQSKINNETMFSVGSVSKSVNAILILKLVDEGMLDLDKDVNHYLKDWKVEKNSYSTNNPVTLRRILSHTAGFSVHGFEDYLPEEKVPTTIQILKGISPAKNEKVVLMHPVGSKWDYSGGGITVSQKVVEDVTGMTYHEAAQKYLFEPLGLKRSTYENPLPASWLNIAKAHNEKGDKVALPRGYETMPEAAASGLWTTPSDIAKLLIAFYNSNKESNKDRFLSSNSFKEATTKVLSENYGLSIGLTTYKGENKFKGENLMQHTGSNNSYKAYYCFFYDKGTGYIALTNGSNGMNFLMEPIDFFIEYSIHN